MMSDLLSYPNTLRCGIGASAVSVTPARNLHSRPHFLCPLGGENAGVFELCAVAPDGGFLFAHEGDVGGRASGAGGAGGRGAAGLRLGEGGIRRGSLEGGGRC